MLYGSPVSGRHGGVLGGIFRGGAAWGGGKGAHWGGANGEPWNGEGFTGSGDYWGGAWGGGKDDLGWRMGWRLCLEVKLGWKAGWQVQWPNLSWCLVLSACVMG